MKELIKALKIIWYSCFRSWAKYKIGCLEINTLGYVFNTAPAHFVGHINTVEELDRSC